MTNINYKCGKNKRTEVVELPSLVIKRKSVLVKAHQRLDSNVKTYVRGISKVATKKSVQRRTKATKTNPVTAFSIYLAKWVVLGLVLVITARALETQTNQVPAVQIPEVKAQVKEVVIETKPLTAQEYAKSKLPADQWEAFNQLITKESNWNPKAKNPKSSAFGIGQLIKANRTEIGDTTDPYIQIDATIKYINQRYGTALKAWEHEVKHNWY